LIHSLTEFADRLFHPVNGGLSSGKAIEKILIQDIADLVRYIFYTVAVWVSIGSLRRE